MATIYGIDLGTTNSLIARMQGDRPIVIPSPENGSSLLPSVVALGADGRATVGERAIALEPRTSFERNGTDASGGDHGVVVRSVKRYMGLGGDELAAEDRSRYAFTEVAGPVVHFRSGDRSFTPSQISAEILRE